jgi:hypothetical protein
MSKTISKNVKLALENMDRMIINGKDMGGKHTKVNLVLGDVTIKLYGSFLSAKGLEIAEVTEWEYENFTFVTLRDEVTGNKSIVNMTVIHKGAIFCNNIGAKSAFRAVAHIALGSETNWKTVDNRYIAIVRDKKTGANRGGVTVTSEGGMF